MPQEDFEKYWLDKFATCIEEHTSPGTKDIIMGTEGTPIPWTIAAMERLTEHVDEKTARKIMADCACQYPKKMLEEMKETYAENGDLEEVHAMLQAQFVIFLREIMKFDEAVIEDIVSRNWGAAGILQDGKILATKIPKSGYLLEYLNEPDAEKRKQLYCHCPRIRDVLKTDEELDPIYCYCGAGFYKGIWEEITGQEVNVEVVKSVLKGDDVCSILISFP